jgi:transposase
MIEEIDIPNDDKPLRDWEQLSVEERTALLIEHGHALDRLPPTCDLGTKIERLKEWLLARGIRYEG